MTTREDFTMKPILIWVAAWALAAPASAQDAAPAADSQPPGAQAPQAQAPALPKTITVKPHDYLWALAKTHYGNGYRWKLIYAANRDKIKDPNLIYPGQVFSLSEAPASVIGEVGARPVETGAAVTVPPEDAAATGAAASSEPPPELLLPDPKPAPAPEPAPEPAPAVRAAAPLSGGAMSPEKSMDDLRDKFAPSQVGMWPSMSRVVKPGDWQEDGAIIRWQDHETAAGAGDVILAKFGKKFTATVGEKLSVYRRDVPKRSDTDKEATYLSTVGTVQVVKSLGAFRYSLLVLQSGDTVQPGDLLKREDQ